MRDTDIASNLTKQGYSYQQTDDAMQQADIYPPASLEASQPLYDASSAAPQGMQPSLMDIPQQQAQQPYPEIPQPEISSMPQPPAYQEQYPQQPYPEEQALSYREQIDEIEALIESIIDEKWQAMISNIGDLNLWKQNIKRDITAVKQEIIRMQARFENIEKAILGKISEYDKNIVNVGAEIKAMEKVLQKVMQPMTENIKELQKITTKLKKRK